MLNADLLEYIRTQLQRGMSEREIRKILADAGWEQNEVNQTLSLSVYEGDHDIETRDLTKFYGKKRGVLSLDLFVRQGEIFGFLGPNGAGKSTTIRLLLRLIRPTSGSIRIFGKDPQTAYASILSNVGYLPGDVRLYEKMTGRQMLDLVRAFHPGKDIATYGDELVARLECDIDTPFRKLSKGNKQKLGILMALSHRPHLAILDEPTAGLDPLSQNEFYRVLEDLKRDGTTVFFSSHNLPEVDRVCDRVGIIRDGRMVDVETIKTLRSHQRKVIEVNFHAPYRRENFEAIDGVQIMDANDTYLQLHATDASMVELLPLLARTKGTDITIAYPDLENVFMKYYGRT